MLVINGKNIPFHPSHKKTGIKSSGNIRLDAGFATIYSYTMNRREKLLEKAKRTPDKLTFDELEKLLKSQGWTFARQKGSHRIWISPENELVPIQSFGKTAKSYQVRRILFIMEREEKPPEVSSAANENRDIF